MPLEGKAAGASLGWLNGGRLPAAAEALNSTWNPDAVYFWPGCLRPLSSAFRTRPSVCRRRSRGPVVARRNHRASVGCLGAALAVTLIVARPTSEGSAATLLHEIPGDVTVQLIVKPEGGRFAPAGTGAAQRDAGHRIPPVRSGILGHPQRRQVDAERGDPVDRPGSGAVRGRRPLGGPRTRGGAGVDPLRQVVRNLRRGACPRHGSSASRPDAALLAAGAARHPVRVSYRVGRVRILDPGLVWSASLCGSSR